MENLNTSQQTPAQSYRLPVAARAEILARSDFVQQRREIERQRLAFSLKNGGDFGGNKSQLGS